MKKFTLITCVLALLVSVISCKDDDENEVNNAPNELSYDGKTYTPVNGYVYDAGAVESHYNKDFYLTDGEADFENQDLSNASFLFSAELYSPGTSEFQTGTFQFNDDGNVDNKHFFDHSDIILDANGNKQLDIEDEFYNVRAGTITVSGSHPSYTIALDVTLDNDKALKGRYSGTFKVIED